MAAKHTPGLWEARASHGSDDFGIIAPDASAEGGWVCVAECFSDIRRANEQALPEAAANARRIVQCVNAHDDLVSALTEYDAAFTELDPESAAGRKRMRLAIIKARAAIAKATGSAA